MIAPYNIKVKSLLQNKDTKLIEVVSAIQIDKYDGLEVMTQRLCYKGKGNNIKFCVNETYCSYYTVESLYKTFDLVGLFSECEFCRLETETIALDEFGMCKDCYKARS